MITKHFIKRVYERAGWLDANRLVRELNYAIAHGRDDYVEKVCRTKTGAVYRFRLPEKGEFFAVRADNGFWLTLLMPGFSVKRRGGKGEKRLNRRYTLGETEERRTA